MRPALAVVLMLCAVALIRAQPPKDPPAKDLPVETEPVKRYGVNGRIKAYPQDTPKAALKSTLAAIEKSDYSYLVAQLLDPKFVDETVIERAKEFEARARGSRNLARGSATSSLAQPQQNRGRRSRPARRECVPARGLREGP